MSQAKTVGYPEPLEGPRGCTMLVESSEVPQLLRRNHIRSGYRPLNQSVRYYLVSAFKLHNELINFWTHLLPLAFIYIRYVHPELFLEPAGPRWQLMIVYGGISTLFVASSFAHLMHSRSQLDHVFWLLVDFSGIMTFSLTVGLARLTLRAGSSAFFNYVYLFTLLLMVYAQYWTTTIFFVLKPFWKTRHVIRLGTCLAVGLWLYIPILGRCLLPNESDVGAEFHRSAFKWLLIAGIFMGANVPECFAPGMFDYFCYGHQLFHVCVFMVTWHVCEAAQIDANAVPSDTQAAMFAPVMKVLVANAVAVGVTVFVLMEFAKRNAKPPAAQK